MRISLPIEYSPHERLAALLNAHVVGAVREGVRFTGMVTDSREVERGDLFLCLRGRNRHGSDFVAEALARGALGVLSDEEHPLPDGAYIRFVCRSVEEALLHAAAMHREKCGARVIAVSGSTGKTTVKEAISAVLGMAPANTGNYNSTIGMPLSVLSLPSASHWVLELGVSHVGEMRPMARALSPDVAVLTNVGTAHVGQFGSLAAILAEKAELPRALRRGGILILPQTLSDVLAAQLDCRMLCTGEEERADVAVVDVRGDATGVRCALRTSERYVGELHWPIPGKIGISVIALAGAVGILEGRSEEEIREGLLFAGAHTPRLSRIEKGAHLLLDDTYNASPESVMNALDVLSSLCNGRTPVAVLGDMEELGSFAVFLHDAVGEYAASRVDLLFTYGRYAASYAAGAMRGGMSPDRIRAYREGEGKTMVMDLLRLMPRRAAVLFKASHAAKLDLIVREVEREL